MSKSDPSEASRINMTDGPDSIAKKIRKAKTDPEDLPGDPKDLAGRPEAANLIGIYAALSDQSLADVCTQFDGAQFSAFKVDLTELAVSVLGPIGKEMARMMRDPVYLDGVLSTGSERARAIAVPILGDVYDIVGLLQSQS